MLNRVILVLLLALFAFAGGNLYQTPYSQPMCSGNIYNQALSYAQSCFLSQYNCQLGQPVSCNPLSNNYQFRFNINAAVY
jgi:hypothetical protein